MRTGRIAIIELVLGAAILATGCSSGTSAQQVVPTLPAIVNEAGITAEGRLEPARFVKVSLSTSGYVDEVLSKAGDLVQPGQVIARLKGDNAQSLETAQANASLELGDAYQAQHDAQRKLDDFAVPRVLAGMTPQTAVQVSFDKLNAARLVFEPYRDSSRQALRYNRWFPALPPRILFDTNEYKALPREYKKHVDVAWVNYRKSVEWVTLEADLESAEARVERAQAYYKSLQDASFGEDTAGVRAALASSELRSPFAGTITDLELKVGEFEEAGTPLVTVADLSDWVVKTTNLTELDVVNVKEGEPATFTLDAVPALTLRGTVRSVAKNYTERQGDIVYEVAILVADPNPDLRWGLTAKIRFEE